ncbi:hypothetical protein [Candidatus Methylacidiphilum infernorum]|uniref:hypothetical protein n=1 Tax=Candidatus Methylacidiphilum infernorum TaxID=511746 RepID=UPI00030C5159|nr:hypothetical protein [Candidatus Methylacidiphilum infernorum]
MAISGRRAFQQSFYILASFPWILKKAEGDKNKYPRIPSDLIIKKGQQPKSQTFEDCSPPVVNPLC